MNGKRSLNIEVKSGLTYFLWFKWSFDLEVARGGWLVGFFGGFFFWIETDCVRHADGPAVLGVKT